MKLLVDQDVYAATIELLRGDGHDVATAGELGLSQADDDELLRIAFSSHRILLTRDRDFGALLFVKGIDGGVVYLRIQPATLTAVHTELRRVLAQYDEGELLTCLVVVEAGRHRIRRRMP